MYPNPSVTAETPSGTATIAQTPRDLAPRATPIETSPPIASAITAASAAVRTEVQIAETGSISKTPPRRPSPICR